MRQWQRNLSSSFDPRQIAHSTQVTAQGNTLVADGLSIGFDDSID
jgi:hypothetical protein